MTVVALSDVSFSPLRYELKCIIAANTTAQSYPCCSSKCPSAFAKPSKQRRALRETAVSHPRCRTTAKPMANVASRGEAEQPYAAEPKLWCNLSSEDKLQSSVSEPPRARTSSVTCVSESAESSRALASPSPSLSSLDDDFDMPPTPRLRTSKLPSTQSIIISPVRPLPPLQPDSRPHSQDANSEEPEFDPFDDVPLLRPLAEDWSSLDRTTSLSLVAEPPEEDPWPFNNALGLYFDPAMNVSTWDAAGVIRSTAPPPSPTRRRRYRQRT